MIQATNSHIAQVATEQSGRSRDLQFDEDFLRLKAIWELYGHVTNGALDLGGPGLQHALGFLTEEMGDCLERLERGERRKRRR
jgi:hypothetical protein